MTTSLTSSPRRNHDSPTLYGRPWVSLLGQHLPCVSPLRSPWGRVLTDIYSYRRTCAITLRPCDPPDRGPQVGQPHRLAELLGSLSSMPLACTYGTACQSLPSRCLRIWTRRLKPTRGGCRRTSVPMMTISLIS